MIFFFCLFVERTCEYLSLKVESKNHTELNIPNNYKGLYIDYGKTLFGRPVYKHLLSEAYIYYTSKTGNETESYWAFGEEYDRGTSFLELQSNSTRPEEGGNWIGSSTNPKIPLFDISLECYSEFIFCFLCFRIEEIISGDI